MAKHGFLVAALFFLSTNVNSAVVDKQWCAEYSTSKNHQCDALQFAYSVLKSGKPDDTENAITITSREIIYLKRAYITTKVLTGSPPSKTINLINEYVLFFEMIRETTALKAEKASSTGRTDLFMWYFDLSGRAKYFADDLRLE